MTRERAKELLPIMVAYVEGKKIEIKCKDSNDWMDVHELIENYGFEDRYDYRIKPEPRTRPMTRGEVLYMVTTTPAMVVRETGEFGVPAQRLMYQEKIERYEYAVIDETGEPIDGWHKFEVEE